MLYEVLNAVPDDVFKRKFLFNREIMFHSVKSLIKIIEKFRAKLCVRFYHQVSFEGRSGILITKTIVFI